MMQHVCLNYMNTDRCRVGAPPLPLVMVSHTCAVLMTFSAYFTSICPYLFCRPHPSIILVAYFHTECFVPRPCGAWISPAPDGSQGRRGRACSRQRATYYTANCQYKKWRDLDKCVHNCIIQLSHVYIDVYNFAHIGLLVLKIKK